MLDRQLRLFLCLLDIVTKRGGLIRVYNERSLGLIGPHCSRWRDFLSTNVEEGSPRGAVKTLTGVVSNWPSKRANEIVS